MPVLAGGAVCSVEVDLKINCQRGFGIYREDVCISTLLPEGGGTSLSEVVKGCCGLIEH